MLSVFLRESQTRLFAVCLCLDKPVPGCSASNVFEWMCMCASAQQMEFDSYHWEISIPQCTGSSAKWEMRKKQQKQQQWRTSHSVNTILSFLWRLLQDLPLLCDPSTWIGSIAWVNSQLMCIKRARLSQAQEKKQLIQITKENWDRLKRRGGSKSFIFFVSENTKTNGNVWKSWLQKMIEARSNQISLPLYRGNHLQLRPTWNCFLFSVSSPVRKKVAEWWEKNGKEE